MIIDLETARALARSRGKVYDSLGNKIGTIGQVYVDDETGQPNWVTVRTGLFGLAESFAPLDGAELRGGDPYVLPGEIDVKGAPRIDPDGSLTPDEEEQLYTHYASANAGAEESAAGGGSMTGGVHQQSSASRIRLPTGRLVGPSPSPTPKVRLPTPSPARRGITREPRGNSTAGSAFGCANTSSPTRSR